MAAYPNGDAQGHGRAVHGAARGHALAWTPFAVMALGAWLVAGPFTFGAASAALAWSEALSGGALVALAAWAVARGTAWPRWAAAAVGLWLIAAPLLLGAPTSAGYITGVLVGVLVIAFSVIIPLLPGMTPAPGPDIPPGWSHNPSIWLQRAPIITLAFVSFFLARYLASYQLGYIERAWDPFFGDGTERVLESEVSRAFPVSDAGLGALAYLLEGLTGFMGDARRWRTAPWVVLLFGILVVPLGAVSIVLVILQPVAVGAWCTLCLLAALAVLVMIPLALNEVVAMGLFLAQVRREGQPVWRVFWGGGAPQRGGVVEIATAHRSWTAAQALSAMVSGVTPTWNLLLAVALGLWLMASPAMWGSQGAAASSDHLVGPLVVTVAVIAMAEVARPLRFLLVGFGLWLLLAPWALPGATAASAVNDMVAGAALALLSLRRGRVTQRYGAWQRFIV